MNITQIVIQCIAGHTLKPMLQVRTEDLKQWMLDIDGAESAASINSSAVSYTAVNPTTSKSLDYRLEMLQFYLDRLQSKALENTPAVTQCGRKAMVDPREQQRLDSQWILGMCLAFVVVAGFICLSSMLVKWWIK